MISTAPTDPYKCPFFVGIGFDRDALLGDMLGQILEFLEPRLLNFLQFGFVLVDHPFVVITGYRSQTLRQQIVVGESSFNFDDITLFTQMVNRLNQKQFDATVVPPRQAVEIRLIPFQFFHFCRHRKLSSLYFRILMSIIG